MREIKFRAWNGKEMHYNTSHLELWKKKQYNIMQYTGLKDKNGKEIYEGDILEYKWYAFTPPNERQSYCVIDFKDGQFTADEEPIYSKLFHHVKTEWTVCGNIHENPELLK